MRHEHPKKLYRFERATVQRTDTLRAGRLWSSKPKHFNDLNDCQLDFDPFAELGWDPGVLLKVADLLYPGGAVVDGLPLTNEMIGVLRGNLRLSGDDLRATITRAYSSLMLADAIANGVAVCCFFGALPDNALMWAHYGDNHHGFCVEYDVIGEAENLHEVEYSSRTPTITLSELLFSPREAVRRVVATKHLDWAHEREHRIIVQGDEARAAQSGVSMAFPAWLRPARVILGVRLTDALGEEHGYPYINASNVASSLNVSLCRVVRREHGLHVETLVRR